MNHKTKLMTNIAFLPIALVLGLSIIVTVSYLLAGWLMKPVGDDYGWLYLYNSDLNWWKAFTTNLQTENGRYGQNILVAIPYGLFGKSFLKITAFLGVGLFVTAMFFSIQAFLKHSRISRHKLVSILGAFLLFLSYTMLSISYPWIRGPIDNTFQGFLWYPGFVTYTLPLTLLIILVSLLEIRRDTIKYTRTFWISISLFSILLGTFNELIPVLFALILGFYLLLKLVWPRASISRLKQILRYHLPLLVITVGLFIGIGIVYFSPASIARRELVNQSAPTQEVLVHSATMTKIYIETYILGSSSAIHTALIFIILTGVAIGIFAFTKLKMADYDRLLKSSATIFGFSTIIWLASIYLAFVGIYKGYGLGDIFIVPRFEILYNIWLCISLISLGFIASKLVLRIQISVIPNFSLYTSLAILLLMILNVPNILNQATDRLSTVAVFSENWEEQDQLLRNMGANYKSTVSVPVIDIGDSYIIRCNENNDNNWLGIDKAAYYSIPKICDSAHKP